MRICHVITGLGIGGAEQQVAELSRVLTDRGHTVSIVSLTDAAQPVPIDARMQVVTLGLTKRPAAFARCLHRLRRTLARFAPDVVHSHMFHANVLCRLVRPVQSMPRLICTSHSTQEGGRLRLLALRCTDRWADRTIGVSDAVVQNLLAHQSCPAHKLGVVYNGIDVARFAPDPGLRIATRAALGIDTDTSLLLAVGRLVPAKDYPSLLAAFAQVARQQPNAMLAIAGAGPDKATLAKQAQQLGLAGRVQLLGVRHDIPALMNAADLFVSSSAWEGFGLVIAEAMACEKRVVATDCGGVREVIGSCGQLVPPRDSQALADACIAALDPSVQQAEVAGQAARMRIVQRFSLDTAVDSWLRLYAATGTSHVR